MDKNEFKSKWKDADVDAMTDEELLEFKNDCFSMFEKDGFLDKFNSPYDDEGEHNGMQFKVIRRADTTEVDIEVMPVWLIEFENGETAYCYPEEICKSTKL